MKEPKALGCGRLCWAHSNCPRGRVGTRHACTFLALHVGTTFEFAVGVLPVYKHDPHMQVDRQGKPVKRFNQLYDTAAIESAVYELLLSGKGKAR